MATNYLLHRQSGYERVNHKYIQRYWKNGRWNYVYKEVGKDNADPGDYSHKVTPVPLRKRGNQYKSKKAEPIKPNPKPTDVHYLNPTKPSPAEQRELDNLKKRQQEDRERFEKFTKNVSKAKKASSEAAKKAAKLASKYYTKLSKASEAASKKAYQKLSK